MSERDEIPSSVVTAIFREHGFAEPWEALPATGIANHIYATERVVLRIATLHPVAMPDARTESVAAPVARAAGIRTPALLAFDDSRVIVDRPYTLWERVPGEPLGRVALEADDLLGAWAEIGRELARLHARVTECLDPNGWLDTSGYGDPREYLARAAKELSVANVRAVERWLRRLEPYVAARPADRFLHGDLHHMNVMCDRAGRFLALIDWGDACWGDPAVDFTKVPLVALPATVSAYESVGPGMLGEHGVARILWSRLASMLYSVTMGRPPDEQIGNLLAFEAIAPASWREYGPAR